MSHGCAPGILPANSDRLGTLGHNQYCQTGAVSRTYAAISSVLLTCADAVPPTSQARADIVELIDFAQDRFKIHVQTALPLNSLRRENFRWTGLGQRT
jgi:hypothetical protein